MTHQELIDNKWLPTQCKIGTLYFNYGEGLFCRLEDDEVTVFPISDDTHVIGHAKTLEEITKLKMKYDREIIEKTEFNLSLLKTSFKLKYNQEP